MILGLISDLHVWRVVLGVAATFVAYAAILVAVTGDKP